MRGVGREIGRGVDESDPTASGGAPVHNNASCILREEVRNGYTIRTMSQSDAILKRFDELISEYANFRWYGDHSVGYREVDGVSWQGWATKAQNIIEMSFGPDSALARNFRSLYDKTNNGEYWLMQLAGVLKGARDDFRDGFVLSIEQTISAEVLGDFVSASKIALAEGYKDVSAVLACAALEDTLKRYARLHGLDVEGKVLQEVVSALKAKGLVTGAQKTLLDAMPKIRDYAMHANWEKVSSADVNGVIGYVEQFLLTKF